MPSIRAKALAYIRSGRVVIMSAQLDPSEVVQTRPYLVTARVRGHQAVYAIQGEARGGERRWRCPCRPDPQRTPADHCAHAAAAALVVGWPSAALSTPDPEGPTP
jgi:hypothetical protein